MSDDEAGWRHATWWSATVNNRVEVPVRNGPMPIFLVDDQKSHPARRLAWHLDRVRLGIGRLIAQAFHATIGRAIRKQHELALHR